MLHWGSDFPSYALMVESLNPLSSFASRISLMKGDPVAFGISSSSFSFMAAITRGSSSIGISPYPLEATSSYLLLVEDC